MSDQGKDHLEEAKRIMARMLSMPPKPHKAESAKGRKPAAKPAPKGAKGR